MSEPEPVSPCIAVCVLDPATGLCRGCFRTMAEISSWPGLDAAAKRQVLALVAARREQAARPTTAQK